MKTFVKKYIGKGKTSNFGIVKVSIPISEILKYKYEKEGVEYITFEIAALKEPDKFERTHTVYVTVPEEVAEPETVQEPTSPEIPAKPSKKRKASAKK
jgi:hypothetical protein